VLGCDDHESRPEEGVRTGREGLELHLVRRGHTEKFEEDPATFTAADPVPLHQLDRFGPVQRVGPPLAVRELAGVEILQQPIGIRRNA
jgi:hypothetical protein